MFIQRGGKMSFFGPSRIMVVNDDCALGAIHHARDNDAMNPNQELVDLVEAIKVMFVSRATGGMGATGGDFAEARVKLLNHPLTKDRLPKMVRVCRNLDEFWSYIKPMFHTYSDRRGHIRDEFDPLLTHLEAMTGTPSDAEVSRVMKDVPSEYVHEAWIKAMNRRTSDPDGAITAARTLLESVCKLVLDEAKSAYNEGDDLPVLYKKAAAAINVAPSQHLEPIFKQILGGCQTVVEGLGAMRNKLSDAHGRGVKGVRAAPRHAELAVNLSGAMATFLISTMNARAGK